MQLQLWLFVRRLSLKHVCKFSPTWYVFTSHLVCFYVLLGVRFDVPLDVNLRLIYSVFTSHMLCFYFPLGVFLHLTLCLVASQLVPLRPTWCVFASCVVSCYVRVGVFLHPTW